MLEVRATRFLEMGRQDPVRRGVERIGQGEAIKVAILHDVVDDLLHPASGDLVGWCQVGLPRFEIRRPDRIEFGCQDFGEERTGRRGVAVEGRAARVTSATVIEETGVVEANSTIAEWSAFVVWTMRASTIDPPRPWFDPEPRPRPGRSGRHRGSPSRATQVRH
jgi:hypothetical protein